MKEMSDLFCGKAVVGGNYNSTRDSILEKTHKTTSFFKEVNNIISEKTYYYWQRRIR